MWDPVLKITIKKSKWNLLEETSEYISQKKKDRKTITCCYGLLLNEEIKIQKNICNMTPY